MKLRSVIRLARPTDWVKNLFVVPPLLSSGLALEPKAQLACATAFFAFSFVASGVYSINDAIDWRNDRKHPVKRRRPIAARELSPRAGVAAGAVWIALGLATSLLTERPSLAGVLLVYLALQALYNAGLKRVHFIDLLWLSTGFVVRAWAGAVAIGVTPSRWLLASVFFLCLFLAQIKRLCDLESAPVSDGAESQNGWTPPAGYRSERELGVLSFVSGTLAVLTYLMYALSDHSLQAVGPQVRGFVLLTPIVVVVLIRTYRDALHCRSDSPLRILVTDPILVVGNSTFIILAVLILYSPAVGAIFMRPFGVE